MRRLRRAAVLAAVVAVAGASAMPGDAATRHRSMLCGIVSAGGAKWILETVDTPCKESAAGLKLFGAAHLKQPHGQTLANWKGGPRGFSCSVTFAYDGHVQEGDCSHRGGSFEWVRIGA